MKNKFKRKAVGAIVPAFLAAFTVPIITAVISPTSPAFGTPGTCTAYAVITDNKQLEGMIDVAVETSDCPNAPLILSDSLGNTLATTEFFLNDEGHQVASFTFLPDNTKTYFVSAGEFFKTDLNR